MRVIQESAFAQQHPASLLGSPSARVLPPAPNDCLFNLVTGSFFSLQQSVFSELTLKLCDVETIFPNIIVTNSGKGDLIDANNGYSSTELTRHHLVDFPLQSDGAQLTLSKPKTNVRVNEGAYIVADSNYASFVLGELPRLRLYRTALGNKFKLVVHGRIQRFHEELLTLYGIDLANVESVPEDSSILFDVMFHATPTYFHHQISLQTLDFLRTSVPLQTGDLMERVYLSRSNLGDNQDRNIVNEKDFEELLKQQGFKICHPQELSVKQQIGLFQSAEIIVSPFGATWANSVFRGMKKHSLMLARKFTPEFGRIYQMLGQTLCVMPMAGKKYREAENYSKSFRFSLREKDINTIFRFLNSLESKSAQSP